jgi:YidC/Oxa1 family membrane protein insertase
MNFEKNSVIGMVLLAFLLFGYFYFTRQAQLELEVKQKRANDSIAALVPIKNDSASKNQLVDSTTIVPINTGSFQQSGIGEEKLFTLENELVSVVLSNKGGQIKSVQLKKYKAGDTSGVKLLSDEFNSISYLINTTQGQTANIKDLFFNASEVDKSIEGASTIRFTLEDSLGRSVVHQFSLPRSEYMVDWRVIVKGADKIFSGNAINLTWQVQSNQQERDILSEKRETQLGLMEADGFDYFTMSDGLNKKWEGGLKWFGIKQKFFNTTMIAENGFSFAETNCRVPNDSLGIVAQTITNLRSTFPAASQVEIPYKIYIGPNDYYVLKQYKMDLEDMVNLGQGFYAFVKYINRWIVLPVFEFFGKFVSSLGLAIALLTIFIRLLTSPLVYSSYVSGAKMKALKPELDGMKEKFKDDQQAFSLEQMKLYRAAGVNPLGGCIPALLQIPIFFALYSFFNSNIDLRGVAFWWSKDLSAFDPVLTWGFNFPGLGSHLSMFTVLAVATSFLTSLYSMSMTPDQGNPALKYMPYIFPIMLLGIFNGLPSALTWYYTVSNVITLALQFVIQRYIINHDKILAEIDANRKKPKSKSKWQERLEQMQETQKKVKSMQDKTKK